MNLEKTKQLLRDRPAPALMCSFGKDSMALLHLVRETLGDIPVIFYRHPFFPFKFDFADQVTRSWGLTVHDYPPMAAGIKTKPGMLELVARYSFGTQGGMDLPLNTLPPHPRRPIVCGLNDWVLRPKAGAITFPWRTVFMGHKSSDVDPFEGPVPLKTYQTRIGGVDVVFPLRDWTDADVWDYLDANHVPTDTRRYQERRELADKWLNSDYLNACTKCMDPEQPAEVLCPKTGRTVPNVSAQILRLENQTSYIEREAAA